MKRATPAQAFAVKFMLALEQNEEMMGEGAALMVTLDQWGLGDDPGLLADIAMQLPGGNSGEPDSDWWSFLPEAEHHQPATEEEYEAAGFSHA